MKSGAGVLRVFDGVIDRLLCVFGAVLLSQGPEFMQQYLQRLGGHLGEAQRQLVSFQDAASQAGVPFDIFIVQTSSNPDAGLSRLGTVMHDTAERTASLQAAHDALLAASPWSRPFVFLGHLDAGIAHGTWSAYKPAVPVTLEGLLYALTGMLLSLVFYHVGVKRLLALFTRKQSAEQAS